MPAPAFCRAACLSALLTLAAAAHAQVPVAGTVQDGAGRPLPFATAVLLHLPDSAVAASQTTTGQGRFQFEQVAAGRYCLRALALGYAAGRVPVLVGRAAVQVPVLRLAAAATALKEVVVQGRPPVLEQHADRTVVNVDRLNTAGDNALEVLRKAPGVTLDKDDHVQYRGSGGVLVLLDGKRTYMTGDALTTYLKSLPATAISQVELLPNPPASMDAAGTAGVINIRTRRGSRPGLSGSASLGAGYGRYGKASSSANLAYNVGKWRTYARLNTGYSESYNLLTITRVVRDTTFGQANYWNPVTRSLGGTVGADLALTRRQTLGVQLRGAGEAEPTQVSSTSVSTAPDGQPLSTLAMSNPRTGTARDLALNLSYRLALDTLGRELTADADLVRYRSGGHQDFIPLSTPPAYAPGALLGRQRSDEAADVRIRALKADYVHPVPGTAWRVEAGAKASNVQTTSSLLFEGLDGTGAWQRDPRRSNDFAYDETILAAYATASTTWHGLELKAGLRGEQTHSLGESPTTGQRVARQYGQLFPTLFASYKAGEHDQFSVSAGRRITRPSYQSLNPFINYTDTYTAMQGNPFLQPTLARSFVLSYLHRDFQVLSLSYLLETGVVNEVASQNDQTKVLTTTPQNLNRALTVTLTSGGHTEVAKWWAMDNQLVVGYSEVETRVGDTDVQLRRVAWNASSDHTLRLPRGYQLLVGGYYVSPDVAGLFYTRWSGALNLGVKKVFWHERATLALKLADVFYTGRYAATMRYDNIDLTWINRYESRRLSLSLTCKIGGGSTHAARTGAAADEAGRAGH